MFFTLYYRFSCHCSVFFVINLFFISSCCADHKFFKDSSWLSSHDICDNYNSIGLLDSVVDNLGITMLHRTSTVRYVVITKGRGWDRGSFKNVNVALLYVHKWFFNQRLEWVQQLRSRLPLDDVGTVHVIQDWPQIQCHVYVTVMLQNLVSRHFMNQKFTEFKNIF